VREPLRVDVHMHLYRSKADGAREKADYDIWEYGSKPDVAFSRFDGDVDDALAAMREAGFAHGVVANLFAVALLDEAARASGGPSHAERLVESNRWACEVAAAHPELTTFVAMDPGVLGGPEAARHLREMAERHGARGVKLHPVLGGFVPDDPRLDQVYRTCVELGLAVLSHSGSDRAGAGFAEPRAFAPVLGAFPDLTLVLAHLGGASWKQTADLTRAFPRVAFDLCEIIEWTGAPNAPTVPELARLVADVGPDRVMLGTDFPWYDLERTTDLVMRLPGLSVEERESILGRNAARALRLPV
jgi:predicted TIM-barrel fold metal-dependent hydrolase